METFRQYQYDDLITRPDDAYANAKYAVILEYLQKRTSCQILNAGCGSGDLSFLLAEAGHSVVGIDPEPSYIDLADKRKTAHAQGHLCSFLVRAIEEMPLAQTYDCVIATDVLEHIEKDAFAAARLAALVRPGGLLVITVPAMQWLFGLHDEQLGHFRRYTKRSLATVLLCTGLLSMERMRYFGCVLVPVCWLYSRAFRKPYPMVGDETSAAKPSLVKKILAFFLAIERKFPLPLGTSVICFARRLPFDK